MQWFRWWHGTVNDPKFSWVARQAGCNLATVIAVWAALLEHASQEHERGSVGGFDPESYDCTLGLDDGTCQRVIDAMRGKGLLEIDRVAMWDARQNKPDNNAERQRRFREKHKAQSEDKDKTDTEKNSLRNVTVTLHDAAVTVFDHWRKIHGHAGAKLDDKRRKVIASALKLYDADTLCRCIDGYKQSDFHQGKNKDGKVFDSLALMLRDAEHIDAGIAFTNGGAQKWL
jgi:hypothetical protein